MDDVNSGQRCADCGGPVGEGNGPPDGWQLEDGRTVCHVCCVADTKRVVDAMIGYERNRRSQMNWTKWEIGRTEGGRAGIGLILLDGDRNRIVSLMKEPDGTVTFREECDGYFCVTMPKDEAKKALVEALEWIDEV